MPRVLRPEGPEAGQALVEFALVLPLLALILLLIVDFGRVFATYVSLANAAREGARYCALHPGDTTGTQTRVRGELQDQVALETLETGVIACPATGAGQPVTVTARARFAPVTPFVATLTRGPLTVEAPATMVVW